MALPQAIESQAADAENLRKQLYEPPVEDDDAVPPEPPAEPPVADVVPLPTPQPAAPAPGTPGEDATYWKKRFETVQGKLDAEMPRLYAQLREQGQHVASLQAQLAQHATPPTPKDDAPPQLVTQKDIDSFGEDLLDAVRRTAREEIQRIIAVERAALNKQFAAMEQQVGQVSNRVEKTAADRFWESVVALVPDWLSIDADPAWIAWLDTTPEFASSTYRELAGQAIQKGDPKKIAKLVDAWKRTGGGAPPTPEIPSVPATPTVPSPASELSAQVAPSSVRTGAAPTAKRVLTRADYEALYDVRNVQRYGAQKAAEMIAEADLAVAEGRVRWT